MIDNMIRGKPLIAFDGTHASGKTTLKYHVAARLKEKGINCAVLSEPARRSSLVDDVVLRNVGAFDIPLEVDLIMNHISQCIRGTRDGEIILSDRTPINVLAYTNKLVSSQNELENELIEKCSLVVGSWAKFYDLIFYCQDFYSADLLRDNLRSKVIDIQKDIDLETRRQYSQFDCKLQYIPAGLSLEEKSDFVLAIIRNRFSGIY